MRQFFAILADSYREAVDGFVIYAMLALSGVAMLIVGSMSFAPVPPQEAFAKMTSEFNMIPSETGRGMFGVGNSEFAVSEVAEAGSGYKFRLAVAAHSQSRTFRDGKEFHDVTKGDSFRGTVGAWVKQRSGTNGRSTNASAEEQRAVTSAQMEEYLAHQLDLRAAVTATASRVDGIEEPKYAFDITTTSGTGVRGWPHTVKIFFGAVPISSGTPLGRVLFIIEDRVINGIGAGVALLISIIITAFFVPNMLKKGSLDLIVSKPIGRTPLLIYKYVGGLTFIFLISTFTIGGVWAVIALRSGFWDPTFLILIPVLTFAFAILYSVSVLFGVLTRSPIVAMLGTIACMFVFWLAGLGKNLIETLQKQQPNDPPPGWLVSTVDAANTVLPRYKDLDTITSKLIADGTLTPLENRMFGELGLISYPDWTTTIGVSLAFIAVMLAIACWRFQRRDS